MILGSLTKYRDYRARVHTGPGGATSSTSYIMILISQGELMKINAVFRAFLHVHLLFWTGQ